MPTLGKTIRDGCLKTAERAAKVKSVVRLSVESLALVIYKNRATQTKPTLSMDG